jgi:hypothetical protein
MAHLEMANSGVSGFRHWAETSISEIEGRLKLAKSIQAENTALSGK